MKTSKKIEKNVQDKIHSLRLINYLIFLMEKILIIVKRENIKN